MYKNKIKNKCKKIFNKQNTKKQEKVCTTKH